MAYSRILVPGLAACLATALSGCVALGIGAAVSGVSAARQERTFGRAIDDVRVKAAIQTQMEQDKAGAFLNVSVTVIEGRVLLTGRVDDPEQRLAATRAAWAIEGVLRVNNEIEVTDEVGWLERPKDIWIRTQLATVLLADKSIKDVNYTIDVVNGVVYLTGVAQDKAELDRAIADAQSLDGVKRVENYVVLKDDPARYGYVTSTGQ